MAGRKDRPRVTANSQLMPERVGGRTFRLKHSVKQAGPLLADLLVAALHADNHLVLITDGHLQLPGVMVLHAGLDAACS